MRNLEKGDTPEVLATNGAAWLADFLADPNSAAKRYRYRHPDIKNALRVETGWKCVYCESKIGHNTPGDVEHKNPTSKNPALHFEWPNLTVACTECNRRKNDYYVKGAEFLDPYTDDVEACLIHVGPLVFWVPGQARAEITVRALELDGSSRHQLLERKRELLAKARDLLELATTGSAVLQELRKAELERMARVDAEYSAMVIAFIAAVKARNGPTGAPPASQPP